jgi:hypothetical protein
MHGAVDAEALLGAVDESLWKHGADVDIRKALAATHVRRHPENPQLPPSGFDTDNPCSPVSIVSTSVWRSLETWYPKAFGA